MQGKTTDAVKAAAVLAYADAGYPGSQAAEIVGIPVRTAEQIISGHGRWGDVVEKPVFAMLRAQQKAHLEAASRLLASKCLIQVDNQLPKASAYQAAGIYGLLRTHERLDAGEPTEHVAHLHVHEVAEIDGILDKLAQAKAIQAKNQATQAVGATEDAVLITGVMSTSANASPSAGTAGRQQAGHSGHGQGRQAGGRDKARRRQLQVQAKARPVLPGQEAGGTVASPPSGGIVNGTLPDTAGK